MGHTIRTCVIGLRIAEALGLPALERDELHLALLLKDSGCSSNSARMFAIFGGDERTAKRDSKICDWCRVSEAVKYGVSHAAPDASLTERFQKMLALARFPGRVMDALTQARCQQGAEVARMLGLGEAVAHAIYCLDEHWDGRGAPDGLRGEAIPRMARIACLAQTMEVFAATYGPDTATDVARRRSGGWFDPEMVRAARILDGDSEFWTTLQERPQETLVAMTSARLRERLSDTGLDAVCEAFACIVDAKSPFTAEHSRRVSVYAETIACRLGLGTTSRVLMRRAGLLHDLGKLAVPNRILDKPGRPTADEWGVIRQHPGWTARILDDIPTLSRIRTVAAAHHEKLDGTGYHLGLTGDQLDIEMRILAVADIFDALTAQRPYRDALPLDEVQRIMAPDAGVKLDGDCMEAVWEEALPTPSMARAA